MAKVIAVLLFLTALSGTSLGLNTTAGTLLEQCKKADTHTKDVDDVLDAGLCLGYLDGWSDGIEAGYGVQALSDRLTLADNISLGQIARVFVRYMSQHPEKENESGCVVLLDAMIDAKLISLEEWKSKAKK